MWGLNKTVVKVFWFHYVVTVGLVSVVIVTAAAVVLVRVDVVIAAVFIVVVSVVVNAAVVSVVVATAIVAVVLVSVFVTAAVVVAVSVVVFNFNLYQTKPYNKSNLCTHKRRHNLYKEGNKPPSPSFLPFSAIRFETLPKKVRHFKVFT